jgi:arsenite methyltransferase
MPNQKNRKSCQGEFELKDEEIRKVIRDRYGKVAKAPNSCCCSPTSCCTPNTNEELSKSLGYSKEDLSSVPEGANLGLGCGNPTALASLKPGEVVLDLGSGAGFDCFLAANRVGSEGKVIGVDMTHEMLEKARANARRGNYKNVEFRLGEIENLPVADNSVDVIISNCVINLSPNKKRVFEEAFRVLAPGGRLMVSDIVLSKPLPEAIRKSIEAYVSCIAGAEIRNHYLELIRDTGFQKVNIVEESIYPVEDILSEPSTQLLGIMQSTPQEIEEMNKSVLSIKVSALKVKDIDKARDKAD